MKHIGWCLDRIQIAVRYMPRSVDTEHDKDLADGLLDHLQEYADTLYQLIYHKKLRGYLDRLASSSLEGVRLQEQEIERLFSDLREMVLHLRSFILELRTISRERPHEWYNKQDQIVHYIDQKFGGERGDLRKEFQIALHSEEDLRELVKSEDHLQDFLK